MIQFLFKKKKKENKDLLGHAHLVMQSSIDVDFNFKEYAEKHIFNKLSEKSEYGFYYSPYSYFFRYPKWGTITETGFRSKEAPYEIREQYQNHIIVAVFGGSTGFDILVPDEKTFAAQLEMKLNDDNVLLKKVQQRFKVINLSHPGNLVLNQVINYILFCHKMNPDIVISHNGANDLVSAQMNDRTLISKYDIGYPDVLEAWGRKIHDNSEVDIDYDFANFECSNFRPAQPRNSPDDVIESYHSRVIQFNNLVIGNNAQFISGFQPWITSKKKLTEYEEKRLEEYNPYYKALYSNVPMLYDMYDKKLQKEKLNFVVNIHRVFQELEDEISHFGDVCHLLEEGDLVVANEYYNKIRSLFL